MITKTMLIRFYLVVSALIMLNVVLYTMAKISFTGYWTDRVVFWIWLLATPFVVVRFWKNLGTKIYLWLLIGVLILTILPMAIPFFGLLLAGSGSGRLNHFNLENNIRIQTVAYGVMGRPRVQIVKDGLLFDKVKLEVGDEIKKNDSTWLQVRDAKKAKLVNETANSITVKYFFEKDTLQTVHTYNENISSNY